MIGFRAACLSPRGPLALEKSLTISLRALLRLKCAGRGALGKKTEMGMMPWSRSLYSFDT